MTASAKPWIATIYFYLICAVSIITLLFGLIAGLMTLYTIIDPEANLDKYDWQAYSDIEEYKRQELNSSPVREKGRVTALDDTLRTVKSISDEEWQKRWESHKKLLLRGQVMMGKRNLVSQMIIVIVCLPVFFIHWRFARRLITRESEA